MLTVGEYHLAWIVYLCASMLVVTGMWGLLNWVPLRPLRTLMRGLVAVIFLTPVDIPPVDHEWAPALMAAVFGAMTGEDFMPLVGPAYFFALAALLLVVVGDFVAWAMGRQRQASSRHKRADRGRRYAGAHVRAGAAR